jgi:hypothetical protein
MGTAGTDSRKMSRFTSSSRKAAVAFMLALTGSALAMACASPSEEQTGATEDHFEESSPQLFELTGDVLRSKYKNFTTSGIRLTLEGPERGQLAYATVVLGKYQFRGLRPGKYVMSYADMDAGVNDQLLLPHDEGSDVAHTLTLSAETCSAAARCSQDYTVP